MEQNVLTVLQDEDVDIEHLYQSLPPELRQHCESVADLTIMLLQWAKADVFMEYCPGQLDEVRRAVLYHDIGVALMPEKLLCKTKSLSRAETRVMQRHSIYGATLIERYRKRMFKNDSGEDVFWRMAAEIALSHHERWDGSGYPYGQSTTGIAACARAVAVADAFDSLVRGTAFRTALSPEYAALKIRQNAGRQFEPVLAEIFCSHILQKFLFRL